MSFLPGLGLVDPDESTSVAQPSQYGSNVPETTTEYSLAKENEWRFEVPFNHQIKIKLLTGAAEIYGTELVISSTPYVFTGTKAALYTWHGCTFEVTFSSTEGTGLLEYTAEETPMHEYANTHFALEALRTSAERTAGDGPRVLILGLENAGKTSLAKILTGYGVRSGRSICAVNLDTLAEGMLTIPGTMSSAVFGSGAGGLDVEADGGNGWGVSPMSGPSGTVPVKVPLVYYHGLESLSGRDGKCAEWKTLCAKLALAVQGRRTDDAAVKIGGIILDTSGGLVSTKEDALGYDLINHIISEFAINAIICLGSERLYSDIVKRYDNRPTSLPTASNSGEVIQVIKLPKSGGAVDRDDRFMKDLRMTQVRSYLYGATRGGTGVLLSPRHVVVEWPSMSVYRLTSTTHETSYNSSDEDSFLPGGMEDETEAKVPLPSTQLLERLSTPQPAMRNSVLAVMNCGPEAEHEDEIRGASVMGFLYVVDVDEIRNRVTVLSPVAGRVPERAIVWGAWPEALLGLT